MWLFLFSGGMYDFMISGCFVCLWLNLTISEKLLVPQSIRILFFLFQKWCHKNLPQIIVKGHFHLVFTSTTAVQVDLRKEIETSGIEKDPDKAASKSCDIINVWFSLQYCDEAPCLQPSLFTLLEAVFFQIYTTNYLLKLRIKQQHFWLQINSM